MGHGASFRAMAANRATPSIIISMSGCYYDIAGWAGPDHAARMGRALGQLRACRNLPLSQLVFASDYPQAVREPGEVAGLC